MNKEKAIETAVNWWVEKLASKPRHDNGDNSFASIMACSMADGLRTDISPEQLEVFREELTTHVKSWLDNHRFVDLYCDYGPGVGLYEAAKRAKISEHNFPFKTGVKIQKRVSYTENNRDDDYRVLAREGYGCGYTEIGG